MTYFLPVVTDFSAPWPEKIHYQELSAFNKTPNVEVDQLRNEFQKLRTTLQQQQDVTQEDVTLQDVKEDTEISKKGIAGYLTLPLPQDTSLSSRHR
ncbi:hypothetical protein LXL04_039308 [Taraxacum kok-saghyz]